MAFSTPAGTAPKPPPRRVSARRPKLKESKVKTAPKPAPSRVSARWPKLKESKVETAPKPAPSRGSARRPKLKESKVEAAPKPAPGRVSAPLSPTGDWPQGQGERTPVANRGLAAVSLILLLAF